MTKFLRQYTAFALVLVLLFSMVPQVFASETEPDDTATEAVTVPTEGDASGYPADDSAMYGIAPASEDYGIMPLSGDKLSGVKLLNLASPYNYTCTLSSQVYVKYVPAGTSSAKNAGIQNVAWHYYSYGGVADKDKTIYCIEPYKDYNQGSSGNYMDEGVDVWGSNTTGSIGSNAWYALSSSQRSAIAYTLLYSEQRWDDSYSVLNYSKNNNPNYSLRVATQVLIYEIVTGLRDPSSFNRLDSNGYSSGRVLYDAFKDAVPNFRDYYNGIVSDVQNAELLPSFCSSSSSSAPTITVEGDLTWVADYNGVSDQFTFVEDNNDIWFSPYSTEVGFQNPYGFEGTKLYSCYKSRPSTSSSSFSVFYGTSSSYQTCVTLHSAAISRTTGYFKVYVPSSSGNLNITKTTSDGKNLAGWQFSVYSNSACTSLISGPHTTNSSGKISITGLNAGTVYVKEVGHQTSSIANQYTCSSTNPRAVTISSGSTSSVSFTNTLKPGSLSIKKVTSDGKNLQGWQFSIYSNAACTSLLSGPHTTNSSGTITVSNLTAGQTVYVKEIGHQTSSINSQYSCSSTNPQSVTISAGATTAVNFNNTLKPGSLSIKKVTSDSKNLQGWQFSIYSNAACTSLISGPHTTNSSGAITVSNLTAGQTVYVKEIGHQDSSINALYTCATQNPQSVTIAAGGTATVSFSNTLVSGDIKIIKETNTGENRTGWRIGIFTDAACTKPITGSPFVTGTDGIIEASVTPGTYYAKEEPRNDPYWQCDSSVKTITVTAGKTSSATFRNNHLGRIEFQKTTNTGDHLSGWTFRVTDADGNTVGDFTTDASGKAQTGLLSPGKFVVQELSRGDDYWQVNLTPHDVTVKAGETVIDKWNNIQQGLAIFHKETNTGENTSGWEITIYSDEACTARVQTVTTLEDGKVEVFMNPGTYWAKETGDTQDRFENPYWQIDTSVQKFEIKPHEDTAITFRNIHCGSIQIIKTMEPEGPLDGWVFKVTDSTGKEIEGSPFTTTETGMLECGLLQPGTYTVEEQIPEDSLYQCTSANPQTVTVKAGETAKVSFSNCPRPGKITIHKVDTNGEPLADAKFRLEWSEDGTAWQDIQYSDKTYPVMGTCGNEAVVNGCLTTGEDGIVEWGNLYPGILYRVMEQEAPSGYILLTEAAFQGELPEDDLTVDLRVVNGEGFTMPDTGSSDALILVLLLILYGASFAYSIITIRKNWW